MLLYGVVSLPFPVRLLLYLELCVLVDFKEDKLLSKLERIRGKFIFPTLFLECFYLGSCACNSIGLRWLW